MEIAAALYREGFLLYEGDETPAAAAAAANVDDYDDAAVALEGAAADGMEGHNDDELNELAVQSSEWA